MYRSYIRCIDSQKENIPLENWLVPMTWVHTKEYERLMEKRCMWCFSLDM